MTVQTDVMSEIATAAAILLLAFRSRRIRELRDSSVIPPMSRTLASRSATGWSGPSERSLAANSTSPSTQWLRKGLLPKTESRTARPAPCSRTCRANSMTASWLVASAAADHCSQRRSADSESAGAGMPAAFSQSSETRTIHHAA